MTICGLSTSTPKNSAPIIHEKTSTNNNVKKANKRTAIYFEASIFVREIGRINNNLMVPHLNSFATIPAATIMVSKLTIDSKRSEEHTSELQSRDHIVFR